MNELTLFVYLNSICTNHFWLLPMHGVLKIDIFVKN